MTVTLNVLRCPDAVPPETRRVTGGEFSIGRGPDNDWVLPDPDRHLSKRHCMLAFRSGGWQVADLSSNGTFLNRGSQPIGQGQVQELRDGDRLRLGAYEIELRIEAADGVGRSPPRDDPFATPAFGASGFTANPFHDDPLMAPAPAADRFSQAAFGDEAAVPGIRLPEAYDPLAPHRDESLFSGPTQPDHSAPTEDAFTPPRPAASLLPDDWDLDLGLGARPSPPPPPDPFADPRPDPFAEPDRVPPTPVVHPPAAQLPPAQPPVAQPPVAQPPPEPPPVAIKPATPQADDAGLLHAFLRGAGLEDAQPADPAATMVALGQAFRAMVAGLRQALIARAAVKGEFRIEQTMIRSRGNNPLKFSAGDDDALAALLGIGRRVDMSPAAAVADALRDMRLHELATVAAMQSAVRALLAQLDPAALRQAAEQGGGLALVPAQKKARAWDAFEALHARTSQALADDFDSVFGRAFARSYEQALRDVTARDDPGREDER
jgi:type VI secretion system protein ImpI/type VI secretion system protein